MPWRARAKPAANEVAAPAEVRVGAEAGHQARHGADLGAWIRAKAGAGHPQKRALDMFLGVRHDHGAVRHAIAHAVVAYLRIGSTETRNALVLAAGASHRTAWRQDLAKIEERYGRDVEIWQASRGVSTSWPSRIPAPGTREVVLTAPSIAPRRQASSRELAARGSPCSSIVCTRLREEMGVS